MKLRHLEIKDAPYMLEWMKDEHITANFQTDFSSMTLDKVVSFIESSTINNHDLHFAVANDEDEYLGTISLKHIDLVHKKAEYAVCLRAKAQGTNAASFATLSLFEYAFEILGLHRIYLNVYTDNLRANAFYKKIGFEFEGTSIDSLCINNEFKSLNWYAKIKG